MMEDRDQRMLSDAGKESLYQVLSLHTGLRSELYFSSHNWLKPD